MLGTRVGIFLRFAVIFLRSPVIPLIRLLFFQEPAMRRYRRNSVENWGWPPLFFNEKPLFPPISHKKSAGKIFWYWCRKRSTQSENQISPKEKQNWGYRTPKSSPRKVIEKKLEKSNFIQKRDIRFHHLKRAVWPSMWCHFLDISSVKHFWGPLEAHSCRGSCQVGYIVPASWEPPIWSINCKLWFFYPFD